PAGADRRALRAGAGEVSGGPGDGQGAAMTFLQPWMLAALPLVGLPLIIHLINQRRYQTVPWGGMMFLRAARALSSGYSRLRHWLIMLLRMLAVAAVILAIGRPLSRGWLALAGGARPDTAVVVLDRSPSMQARAAATPETKLATGCGQLAASLATLAPQRCLLVAADDTLVEIPPATLADAAATAPLAASADIPAMLRAAYDHIREHAAGTAEIWICSDCRSNDWSLEAGGWAGLRDAFAKVPQQVRFQLIAFDEPPAGNLAVRLTATRLETRGDERELLVNIVVTRPEGAGRATVPITFEIGGATTSLDLELAGHETVLANHSLPLGRGAEPRGWGRVSIPADTCQADNEFYFVYGEPPPRVSLVVAEEAATGHVLELAASIPPSKELSARADRPSREGLATAAWDEAAVLAWQGPLPSGRDAELVERFVSRGGQAIFFPPEAADATVFAGLAWGDWTTHPQPVHPEQWRSDEDLLANTLSGGALPVGELEVRRSCRLTGEHVPLAALPDGVPLVARVPDGRGIFFCATLPRPGDSTLASEGIVLYALLQRALERGLEPLAAARQEAAGPTAVALLAPGAGLRWERLVGPPEAVSTVAGL
ncbi:MAG: hypothetical protein FJ275_11495, partial [Planctomycetes bacterium]|nr:hypothetical protein [Planctomycetota bacterium]